MPRCLYLILFFVFTNYTVCFAVKPIKPPIVKLLRPPVAKTIKPPAVLKTDSSTVSIRNFDKAALQSYSKQPVFNYHEEVDAPSGWARFWRAFWRWVASLFHSKKTTTKTAPNFHYLELLLTGLKYLGILAGIGAIVFVIVKMIGIDMANIFRRKPTSANLNYAEAIENIHEIDFDDELERAVASHNYRLAVRLLYLKSLKQLSDAALITWQPEKTNTAYINELTDARQRSTFKSLTHQFEYVWYGGFLIDAPVFNRINTMFHEFKSEIA